MPHEPLIHLIDDDDAVRGALQFLLETEGLKVRTYPDAEAFLDQIRMNGAGCVVTDIRMPGMSGLELIERLRALHIHLPVVVITGHGDVPLAIQAMQAGVMDFLEKPFDDERLLTAVRGALNEGQARMRQTQLREEVEARLAALSARERQVLEGVVAGQVNKVIAHALGISMRTVEVYRANLMSKMRAESLSDLVRMTLMANGLAAGEAGTTQTPAKIEPHQGPRLPQA
ncbi:DNA-binding response regulator [Caulobacter sp. CCUG 60055]|uniref:response regulator FixJ n=1 Tax=Caulobacter sp. CCUG 60055 TaxID=2100090 RepID=UPI001FA75B21|nr:response regulator FixJ [Caulobacter sp. CCUG 60055]MCI3179224.1 DNA-binding response regulator [Caulobacter sp. CCUG 60055]